MRSRSTARPGHVRGTAPRASRRDRRADTSATAAGSGRAANALVAERPSDQERRARSGRPPRPHRGVGRCSGARWRAAAAPRRTCRRPGAACAGPACGGSLRRARPRSAPAARRAGRRDDGPRRCGFRPPGTGSPACTREGWPVRSSRWARRTSDPDTSPFTTTALTAAQRMGREPFGEQRLQHVGLAREVVEQQALGHTGALGDTGGGRGIEAGLGDEILCGVEDPVPGAGVIGAGVVPHRGCGRVGALRGCPAGPHHQGSSSQCDVAMPPPWCAVRVT